MPVPEMPSTTHTSTAAPISSSNPMAQFENRPPPQRRASYMPPQAARRSSEFESSHAPPQRRASYMPPQVTRRSSEFGSTQPPPRRRASEFVSNAQQPMIPSRRASSSISRRSSMQPTGTSSIQRRLSSTNPSSPPHRRASRALGPTIEEETESQAISRRPSINTQRQQFQKLFPTSNASHAIQRRGSMAVPSSSSSLAISSSNTTSAIQRRASTMETQSRRMRSASTSSPDEDHQVLNRCINILKSADQDTLDEVITLVKQSNRIQRQQWLETFYTRFETHLGDYMSTVYKNTEIGALLKYLLTPPSLLDAEFLATALDPQQPCDTDLLIEICVTRSSSHLKRVRTQYEKWISQDLMADLEHCGDPQFHAFISKMFTRATPSSTQFVDMHTAKEICDTISQLCDTQGEMEDPMAIVNLLAPYHAKDIRTISETISSIA